MADILGQIANPQMADIAGAIDYREQKMARDEAKRKQIRMNELMGKALSSGLQEGSVLHSLATEYPEGYIATSKAMGIDPADGSGMHQMSQDVLNINMLNNADPSGAKTLEFMEQQRAKRSELGLNVGYFDKGIAAIKENPGQFMRASKIVSDNLNPLKDKDVPSGLREFEGLTKGLSAEDKEKARRVELGLDARAVGSSAITTATTGLTNQVAQSEGIIEGAKAGGKENAELDARLEKLPTLRTNVTNAEEVTKGSALRRDLFKTQGLAAAENVPTIRRAIDLQEAINSGGGANAIRKMANFLGAASQDEGELNSLFGQNILGQLKSTFGGNPTEGERQALEQAQASFSQTGKINSKLLKNALKLAESKIERGRRAAAADKDDATMTEIDAAMNVHFGDDERPKASTQKSKYTIEVLP